MALPKMPPFPVLENKQLAILRPFQSAQFGTALWQVVSTFFLYFACTAAMYVSIRFSVWLTLALAVPASGLVVRIFMLQHDCGHNSLFRTRRANSIVGSLCSLITLTPFAYWRRLHARHHGSWNDLDGRGNLSEEALAAFSRFFLETCLDQVSFMESLVQPDRLRARILLWAEEEIRFGNLPPKTGNILEAVLYRGELPRGDAAGIAGTGDRQARRLVSTLLEKQVLTSESSRSPLRLAFPASLAPRWMPGLFPEKTRAID